MHANEFRARNAEQVTHDNAMDYNFNNTNSADPYDRDFRHTLTDGGCQLNAYNRQRCTSGGKLNSAPGLRAATLGLPIFQSRPCRDPLNTSGCGPKKRCVNPHIFTLDDYRKPEYKCGRAPRVERPNYPIVLDKKCRCALR